MSALLLAPDTGVNLFTAPACKISGLKDARTRLQTPLLSTLCVLMEILSPASAKQKTKRLKGGGGEVLLNVLRCQLT